MLLWNIILFSGPDGKTPKASFIIDPSLLPEPLAQSIQMYAVREGFDAYVKAMSGNGDALQKALVIHPDPVKDIILPMFFYDTPTIPGASYYIKEKDRAVVCDVDGNDIHSIELTPIEKMMAKVTRAGCMLDPKVKDLARPKRVHIGEHPKEGRSVYYYDSKDRLMYHTKYSGEANLGYLRAWSERPCVDGPKKFDFQWMIDNGVQVTADESKTWLKTFSDIYKSYAKTS